MNGSKSQSQTFQLDEFVQQIRLVTANSLDVAVDNDSARANQTAAAAVHTIMRSAFSRHHEIAQALPDYDEDEVILFEDDSVSIWFCRFQPGLVVPAHDHQMPAFIGVFAGTENNSFYSRQADGLREVRQSQVDAGDVIAIDAKAIHSVSCPGSQPSCALHVYLGKLTTVERSLFLWGDGEQIPFTQENYDRLVSTG